MGANVESTLTYVFCLVASARKPTVQRGASPLPGMGRLRLLEVDGRGRASQTEAERRRRSPLGPATLRKWLVVADAPSSRYGERAINRRLSDLEWVARAAVAHEAVVELFIAAPAVLPMKLFTIFINDDRARVHVARDRRRVEALLRRLAHHLEWGVRVTLDRTRLTGAPRTSAPAKDGSGVRYLARKKAQRDAAAELANRARETVAELCDRLAALARSWKRRAASELPVQSGPLLLDAAFLVPRSRTARFRRLARREARALERHGYGVTLTGPWPPYSFIQD